MHNYGQEIKDLSNKLGVPQVSELLDERLSLLQRDTINLVIVGSDRDQKMILTKELTSAEIKEEKFAPEKDINIVTEANAPDADTIVVENTWMKQRNLTATKLHYFEIVDNPTTLQLGLHFAKADVCIYIINSNAPLTKSDMVQLEALDNFGVPTLLVLANSNVVMPTDYDEIKGYVKGKVKKFTNVTVLTPDQPKGLVGQIPEIMEWLDTSIGRVSAAHPSRAALTKLFYIDAIIQLYTVCKEKTEGLNKRVEDIENSMRKKTVGLSDLQTKWMIIQNDMMQHKNETIDKINGLMTKNRNEIIRQLSHNVEMCNDPKLYWEKELPYRLEDVMRINAQAATQIINADIMATIKWLNLEIKKSFNRSLNSIDPISYTVESTNNIQNGNIEMPDTKKMRIVARIGTAATVVAAGTLFATMGIGGMVVAASMLAGLGAEFFMGKKQDEAKKKIIETIPSIVDRAQSQISIDTSENLGRLYSDILTQLQACQEVWEKESKQEIETEKNIALYNVKQEEKRLAQIMDEINALSANFE